MIDSHETDHTAKPEPRVVKARGGRTSARIEAQIAANMDTIAIAASLEVELEKRLRAQVRQLHVCQKLERDLCDDCKAIQALRHEIVAVKAARVRDNLTLCRGQALA